MQKYFLLLLLGSFIHVSGQGVIFENGKPSVDIPTFHAPKQDNEKLRIKQNNKQFDALTFAKPIDVSLDCEKEGSWQSIPNDRLLWQLKIHSPGATSLNLAFDKYVMPQGGSMTIYTTDKQFIAGPFTSYDNKTNGELWSPIILSDEIIIQVIIPAHAIRELELSIGKVNHGFNDRLLKSFSQSCHLDVVCGAAEGFDQVEAFRNVIRSVGVYSIQGTRLCTGALINNAQSNCRPYFLTADHCGVREDNASTVVIHWNYENSVCRLPNSSESGGFGDGVFDISNRGSQIRSSLVASDMMLLELDDEVPAEANAYFAGWNADPTPPTSAVCIHHPNVDEKRISFDFDPLRTDEDNVTLWRIDDWEIGSTESGSSGAPIFNSDQQIVAQLFGGIASCDNGGWDLGGKISESWIGNGLKSGGLQQWLDPNDTGITELNGRECSAVLNSSENSIEVCNQSSLSETIILSINDGFSSDATLSFESPDPAIVVEFESMSISRGENVIVMIEIGSELAEGSHDINIKATSAEAQSETIITILASKDSPNEIAKIGPSEEGTVGKQVTLEWADIYSSYQIQLSSSPSFSPLIIGENIDENKIRLSDLENETQYYWRVRGVNSCGVGIWNEYSFETGIIECMRVTSDDLPKEISAGDRNTVFSTINFPDRRAITDVNIIQIKGTHSWIGDLQFRLQSPSGKEIVLLSQECETSSNFNLGFDDESNKEFECPINRMETYKPNFPLSTYIDELSNGDWKLKVLDLAEFDGGEFESWTLELCVNLSKNVVSTEELISEVLEIYPNPAENVLFIKQKTSIKTPSFKMYSLIGQEVLKGPLENQIDISTIQNGIYLISIFEENEMKGLKKIVISK